MNSASDTFINYYQLLGIDAKADRQTVKQAYLAKIKEWHPDKNPDRTDEAEEKTKVLNQAYQILGDPEQRKNYDRMLRYTEGKDFNEYINDEAIRDKLDKAYPALKTALKNVQVLYALFKDTRKRKIQNAAGQCGHDRRRIALFHPAGGFNSGFHTGYRLFR